MNRVKLEAVAAEDESSSGQFTNQVKQLARLEGKLDRQVDLLAQLNWLNYKFLAPRLAGQAKDALE
jgi:hypothetical protein